MRGLLRGALYRRLLRRGRDAVFGGARHDCGVDCCRRRRGRRLFVNTPGVASPGHPREHLPRAPAPSSLATRPRCAVAEETAILCLTHSLELASLVTSKIVAATRRLKAPCVLDCDAELHFRMLHVQTPIAIPAALRIPIVIALLRARSNTPCSALRSGYL
jgi:hypothetical protein